MKQLSKNYRNDTAEPLPKDLSSRIDSVYLQSLVNLQATNPKILVVYSGGNAVGKSTLSARIAQELNGLVIENDAIKRAILQLTPEINRQRDLNPYTWRYGMELYKRLPNITNNGLTVRDGIIDWYYDRILPIFENAGYRIFIVQFEQTDEQAIEAIKRRGDLPTVTVETLLNQLEDHKIHQKRFRSEYTADVILSGAKLHDHDAAIKKLRDVISQLNAADEYTAKKISLL